MRTAATALAASLALSACNKASDQTARSETAAPALPDLPATLPLASGAATPVAYAPGPSELPDTRAIPAVRTVAPGDAYAYADQAYGFMNALGDAPPDYGFDYDGVDPWAWQGYDDSVSFAEPIDGGYRYYYYRPDAETPYFIRDPRYGYGYDDGQLAVVYAADGAVVPYESYGPQIGYASRYFVRGRDLWRASRANPRRGVIAANWVRQRPVIAQSRARWQQNRPRQPGWVAYHETIAPRQQRHWQPEEIRREADTRRYAAWQQRDFRTPPPPRAIPVRWQQASWAKDKARFAPAQAALERFAARPAQPGRESGLLERLRGDDRQRAGDDRRPDIAPRPDRAETVQRQIAGNQARRRETMQVVNEPQRLARPGQDRRAQEVARGQRIAEAPPERARREREPQTDARRQAQRPTAAENIARADRQQPRAEARAQARAGREQMQVARGQERMQQARAAEAGRQQARAEARVAQQSQRDQARQAQQSQRAQAESQRAEARQAPRAAQPQAAPRPSGGGNPGGGGHGGRPDGDRSGPPRR
ncbi:hypothetical protein [Sphingomonas sp. EC-HK361]|uniref:hypothetical protein n=1 Tax=Sphingomonas sp. EC-HK361 TaxID=2038397 RepID=UPI00125F2DED|nr:hypothetical protein [Sphingomonas sp. EC-HK361]